MNHGAVVWLRLYLMFLMIASLNSFLFLNNDVVSLTARKTLTSRGFNVVRKVSIVPMLFVSSVRIVCFRGLRNANVSCGSVRESNWWALSTQLLWLPINSGWPKGLGLSRESQVSLSTKLSSDVTPSSIQGAGKRSSCCVKVSILLLCVLHLLYACTC